MLGNIESVGLTRLESPDLAEARTNALLREAGIFIPASQSIWTIVPLTFAILGSERPSWLVDFLSILAFAGFFVSAGAGYAIYLLVNRRNEHLAREQIVLVRALDLARSRSARDDLKALLPLSSAERNFLHFAQHSGEKSAILWGLVSAVPYAGWLAMIYTLSFLGADLKKHEISEDMIIQDVERSLQESKGLTAPVQRSWSPFRNSLGYVAICLFFLGCAAYGMIISSEAIGLANAGLSTASNLLLGIVVLIIGTVGFGIVLSIWLHLAIDDPRAHFASHRVWEQTLLQSQPGNPST